jgi:hypothetical protein
MKLARKWSTGVRFVMVVVVILYPYAMLGQRPGLSPGIDLGQRFAVHGIWYMEADMICTSMGKGLCR